MDFDVVIVGASFGGVSAALAAGASGKKIALIDKAGHVGGQATSQGLNRWDETLPVTSPNTYGSTWSYQKLKQEIRNWYADNTELAPGVDTATFNPGFSAPNRQFSADCAVVEGVLRGMLAAAPNVTLILNAPVQSASVNDRVVESITLAGGRTITAAIFLDATDLGEMLPLCGIDWVIGAEAKSDTGEAHAEDVAMPGYIQPITVALAVEHRPDSESHVIAKPSVYSQALIDAQGFGVYDNRNGFIGGVFTSKDSPHPEWETIFNYRQYVDAANFHDTDYAFDRSTINVGCNDYQAAVIPTGDTAKDDLIVEDARAVSLAYLYWLQTEAPRDDGKGKGYPNLAPRADMFGRADGTAPQAYVRESRRLAKPLVRLLEQHISVTDESSTAVRAPMNFADSCGICDFAVDVHQSYGPPGTKWIGGIAVRPFEIPLGSLVASDCTNLIAACKNIGATHITGAATRVHPGEWAIGEAAGILATYCAGQAVTPAAAHANASRVAAIQLRLLEHGIPIYWWSDLDFDKDPVTFIAAHLVGVRGLMSSATSLQFRPSDPFTQLDRETVGKQLGKQLPWPASFASRAKAAVWLCAELGLPANDIVAHWNQ